MQPVMQQTNVIHVGQGGTVIFPSSQQVNQVRPTQNAMSNQETSFHQNPMIFELQYFSIPFLGKLIFVKSFPAAKSTVYRTCWQYLHVCPVATLSNAAAISSNATSG